MKNNLFFFSILISTSINIFAQSIPDQNHECSGEVKVPSLTCINPNGGNDVRLYIEEFQTCTNGKITELTRSIIGMNNVQNKDQTVDISTIFDDKIDITFAENRILIDEKNRADNLSFILPTKAVLHDENSDVELILTDKTAPDYEDADTFHYIGSFKKIESNGTTSVGELNCSVYN